MSAKSIKFSRCCVSGPTTVRIFGVLALLTLLTACPAPSPDGVPLAKRIFIVDQTAAAEDQVEALPQALRRKRKRWGPAPLYVDGKFKGLLRYPELHPGLPTLWEHIDAPQLDDEDRWTRRFAWLDLFALHGVDVSKIKAVHWYGGRTRISIVSGDELRRVGRSFRFSFNNGEGGTLRQRPPKDGVDYNTGIDIVGACAVYVDREPPTYDDKIITFPDGHREPVRDERGRLNIPYSDGEQHGGTRVYVDGVYTDAFRRRALTAEMLADPKDKTSPYRVSKALESMGIKVDTVKRIQVWTDGDKQAADWGEAELAKLEDKTFVLTQHSRGRITLTGMGDKTVVSMMVYIDLTPADRAHPSNDGSTDLHGDPEKLNNSAKP